MHQIFKIVVKTTMTYDYLHNMRSSCIYMEPIVESDTLKIVSKFNVIKSAGNDNIGNFIIKKVQSEIVKPLTNILTYICQQVLFIYLFIHNI